MPLGVRKNYAFPSRYIISCGYAAYLRAVEELRRSREISFWSHGKAQLFRTPRGKAQARVDYK